MALKTSNGSQTLSPQHIKATGIERNRLIVSVVLGIVLVALTLTYMYTIIQKVDAPGLLAFVGTAYGLLIGSIRHSA